MLFDPELLWHFPRSAGLAGLPSSHPSLSALFILLSLGNKMGKGGGGRGEAMKGEGWSHFSMLLGKVEWEKEVIGHG